MALTDSLDAATQQVLALVAQLKLSNARVVQAQDSGSADNVTLNPLPAVANYGPDLLLLADIAAPNATTTPKVNVSGLGWLTITNGDGSAVVPGVVAGKVLLGLSSAQGGGYVARLVSGLSAGAILAMITASKGSSVAAGTINPLSGSTLLAYTPSSGATQTRSLTFTAPTAGLVTALAFFYTSNAPSPTNSTGLGPILSCSVSSASAGTVTGQGSTIYVIIANATAVVAAGETVTVQVSVAAPVTGAGFPASELGVSYTFVPKA